MATSWFAYDGSGDVNAPSNYSPVTSPPNCPSPNRVLCAIFAEVQLIDGQQKPVITAPLQTEIANVISTHIESANVVLKP